MWQLYLYEGPEQGIYRNFVVLFLEIIIDVAFILTGRSFSRKSYFPTDGRYPATNSSKPLTTSNYYHNDPILN